MIYLTNFRNWLDESFEPSRANRIQIKVRDDAPSEIKRNYENYLVARFNDINDECIGFIQNHEKFYLEGKKVYPIDVRYEIYYQNTNEYETRAQKRSLKYFLKELERIGVKYEIINPDNLPLD